MINKKVLLVGLGLATATTFAGCVNPLKPNVCLYGCPMSSLSLTNISEAESFNEDDLKIIIA